MFCIPVVFVLLLASIFNTHDVLEPDFDDANEVIEKEREVQEDVSLTRRSWRVNPFAPETLGQNTSLTTLLPAFLTLRQLGWARTRAACPEEEEEAPDSWTQQGVVVRQLPDYDGPWRLNSGLWRINSGPWRLVHILSMDRHEASFLPISSDWGHIPSVRPMWVYSGTSVTKYQVT